MAGAIHAAQAPGRRGDARRKRSCPGGAAGYGPGVSITAFDTLAAARSLEAAGFAREQAEAIANAVRDAVTESAATKADLTEVKTELKAEIAEVRAELGRLDAKITDVKADIARLSARIDALMLRFAVFGIGLVGIAIAAIKLL